jgi:hypothetical protein
MHLSWGGESFSPEVGALNSSATGNDYILGKDE